jgi:ribosome assembly protein YihI (activator of Der GTPase)
LCFFPAHGPRIARAKSKQFAPKRVKKFKPTKVQSMSKVDQELFAKLDKLELNEMKNEELERLDALQETDNPVKQTYGTTGIPKRNKVWFADEVTLQRESDSDDSSEREDQDTNKTIMVNFTSPTSDTGIKVHEVTLSNFCATFFLFLWRVCLLM